MKITDYQSKYYAYDLTKRSSSSSPEKLAGAVAGAQVDLNPHQVDAALFAFESPLSKGALLADEVGLGKTIEAGLVIAQKWAERQRRLLIIVPANLRKQWYLELTEKFFLPCVILETATYDQASRGRDGMPFVHFEKIVICSYQFAKTKAADIAAVPWDLVVIDEAHRLRNVYKPTSVIANALKSALRERNKLLLTATPLQNSLLELYGIVSLIDEHIFGDIASFREQYAPPTSVRALESLRDRLQPVCHRTLRRQVSAYIPFTSRLPLLEQFTPDDDEDRLYSLVSEYLRRPNLQALPSGQRSLMTLVLRKLLSSSTHAIAGALMTIANRLKSKLRSGSGMEPLEDQIGQDYEPLPQMAEEWESDEPVEVLSDDDRAAIESEIADIESFAAVAASIGQNAKGRALVKALGVAMDKAKGVGAEEKAVIFTESRRTQDYLLRLLSDSVWKDGLVLFNGSNSDGNSSRIYSAWAERHAGSDRATGSRSADIRTAIVDYFRDEGKIMIATEAAAEGINLQFCSLVVNYDLPWNPQRIEQRIGRCHRYGQKHDVVVVNFLNRTNEADQRVFQLLAEKFQLFEGIFGVSDEVLGSIESGVSLEKRINEIYQRCRTSGEIRAAFDQLQLELSSEISEAMTQTKRKLLERFDDEVRDKLRIQEANARVALDRHEKSLMRLTQHELGEEFRPVDDSSFLLEKTTNHESIPSGMYELPRRSGKFHVYRLGHPLAEKLIARARARVLPVAKVVFHYGEREGRISILESLRGCAGYLCLFRVSVESLDQTEDRLVFVGRIAGEDVVDDDMAQRLLSLPAEVVEGQVTLPAGEVEETIATRVKDVQAEIAARNVGFVAAEADKLERWADDLKTGLEEDIKDIDGRIKEARKNSSGSQKLEDKLLYHKLMKSLELERSALRRSLYAAQDEVDRKRDQMIAGIEAKLSQKTSVEELFRIGWAID